MSITAGLIGAGILSTVGALGSAGLSYGLTQMSNKRQLQYQKQFFDYTNDYNLPLNQRNRLLAGGYNPNLAYGDVNGVSGASMPSVGAAPRYQFDKDLFGLQLGAQLKQMDAQTDLIKAQEWHQHLENMRLQSEEPYWNDNAQIQNAILGFTKGIKGYQYDNEGLNNYLNHVIAHSKLGNDTPLIARDGSPLEGVVVNPSDTPLGRSIVETLLSKGINNDLAEKRIEVFNKQISEIEQRIELMKKQGVNLDMRTTLLQIEKDMKSTLGVSYNDNLGFRLLALLLHSWGVDIGVFGDYLKNDDSGGKNPISRGSSDPLAD